MKKGAIDLSVRFIVIIVLVLSFLIVGLGFIDKSFQEGALKFEQHIISGAPGPPIEIANPDDGHIVAVLEEVKFQMNLLGPSVKMEGYWWDFEDDGIIDLRIPNGNYDISNPNPTTFYTEPGDYIAKVRGINKQGGLGEDSVKIRVFTNNIKDESKYSDNSVFFIEVKTKLDGTVDNWEDLFMAIPITRWFGNSGDISHKLIAITKPPGESITKSDVDAKLNGGKAILLNFDIAGSGFESIDINNPEKYLGLWDNYQSVVITPSDNEDGGLIAALFAAYYNAPLIFLVNGNEQDYRDQMVGQKKVYAIDVKDGGTSTTPLSQNVNNLLVNSWSGSIYVFIKHYDSQELKGSNNKVNRLVELHSEPST